MLGIIKVQPSSLLAVQFLRFRIFTKTKKSATLAKSKSRKINRKLSVIEMIFFLARVDPR